MTLSIEYIGDVTKEALTNVLLDTYSKFEFYRTRFHCAGLKVEDIRIRNPLEILRSLPILESHDLPELFRQSLAVNSDILDLEASSGTTGIRKRRPITHNDARCETEMLVDAFRMCGIGPSDRVACLDTGPLTLMASFTEALDHLGVTHSYAFTASPDSGMTMHYLAALNPTVIITLPSVLNGLLDALCQHHSNGDLSLRAIVYAGERLTGSTHLTLNSLNIEVFSYYGASETSVLGVECRSHEGVHLFTDANIIEAIEESRYRDTHNILVTTLRQEGFPLLRYALKDKIRLLADSCSCGLTLPKIEVLERVDDSVSVYGVKVNYYSIHAAVFEGISDTGPMEANLTDGAPETLALRLPDRLATHEQKLRQSLILNEPDIGFLLDTGFLKLKMEFVKESLIVESRKSRLVDQRKLCVH